LSVGKKPEKKPAVELDGSHGVANGPDATEWFAAWNSNTSQSPSAALISDGLKVRSDCATMVWLAARATAATAEAASRLRTATMVAGEKEGVWV
jgi:hypothetical protein